MNIGENIKKFRKEKGMTQKQLAIEINKSERMIQKYENGEVDPSLEVLKDLCKLFHVEIQAFLDGDTYIIAHNLEFRKYLNFNSKLINEIIHDLHHNNEIPDYFITDEDIDYFTESVKNHLISLIKYATIKNFKSFDETRALLNNNNKDN